MSVVDLRLGIQAHTGLLLAEPGLCGAYCEALEAGGVESVWLPEHAIVAESAASAFPYGTDGKLRSGVEGDRPDPLELLAYLAAFSTNLRLGTGVLIAPLQSPVVLAKRAATVDVLSGGRLLLGLGVGWQREEYAAVGVPFEERGQRLEEAIPVLRTLWEKSPASYEGKTVRFERVYSRPAPFAGTIPIITGGNSPAAIDRAARLADGWYPFAIGPDEFGAGADALRRGSGGRSVEITAWPGTASKADELDPAYVQRFVDAGATRIVYQPPLEPVDPLGSLRERLRQYQTEVLARLAPARSEERP
jgi:probable F420-dependent oxidoreductase